MDKTPHGKQGPSELVKSAPGTVRCSTCNSDGPCLVRHTVYKYPKVLSSLS